MAKIRFIIDTDVLSGDIEDVKANPSMYLTYMLITNSPADVEVVEIEE
jgi:hypothetical protein